MSSIEQHYETLLAPVYLWMAGGIEHALSVGATDMLEHQRGGGIAVDLGAGFGMHAIPLARAGYRVLAIDSSGYLLDQLRNYATGLPIQTVVGDLLTFEEHVSGKADLIVCMGDTLTHLEREADVHQLLAKVATALNPGGRFVATFRDYTRPPVGTARFIPVRSDADRIHTCFLEEHPEHVTVHDIIHERVAEGWGMRVSSYNKLRLLPESLRRVLEATGLRCTVSQGPRGMLTLIADA